MTPEQAIEYLPAIAGATPDRLVQPGAVADTWLLARGDERIVLRIDRAIAARMGLNRRAELKVLDLAARACIGPAVLAADPVRGLLATRFLKGRQWSGEDLHDPAQLTRLGGLLRKVHELPVTEPALDLAGAAHRYANVAASREAQQIARQLCALLPPAPERLRLCHADPTAPNILDDGRLILLDWEYAGSGDPLFDLAVAIEHHSLSRVCADALLSGYGRRLDRDAEIRLRCWREVYGLLKTLWIQAVMD